MGHSILQKDMPDDEDYHCEPKKRRKLRYSPSAWLTCFNLTSSWPVAQCQSAWTLWFCQYLGVQIPQLLQFGRRQDADRPRQRDDQPPSRLVCPCHRHVIDSHGDHIHTCRQHTGSTKDAHETILDAMQQICHASGLSTQRLDIPAVRKAKGKTGRGDLLIKDADVGGHRHLADSGVDRRRTTYWDADSWFRWNGHTDDNSRERCTGGEEKGGGGGGEDTIL